MSIQKNLPEKNLPESIPTLQALIAFINSNGKSATFPSDLCALRSKCYARIIQHRKLPIIIYASNFLNPALSKQDSSIGLDDVVGFSEAAASLDSGEEVDVLLHSPGGTAEATERIVEILRNRFNKINFLIPHSAYSAATMLALSGNKIIMHPNATLGPIDPQFDGIPARAIINGFENAKKDLKDQGATVLPAYIPLLEKYSLHLFERCKDSEKLAKKLVSEWLKKYMFSDEKNITRKIKKIVNYFSDYEEHFSHSRPLLFSKIDFLGLKIERSDMALSNLLWEAFILLSGSFDITPSFVKLYETSNGKTGISIAKNSHPVKK